MLYSLLGRTVWFGLKLYLGRKYGRAHVPKSLLASAAVGVGVAVGVAVLRARSDES
jgi:membrane protein DedA with SNARE-associated domain